MSEIKSDDDNYQQLISKIHANQNGIQTDSISDYAENVSELDVSPTIIRERKSWAQRTFSPMGAGSVRGSIFALIATAMGSGLLALPENAEQTGIIYTILIIILAGLLSLTAMYFLAEMGQKTKILNYSKLVEYCLGTKLKTTLEIIVVVYCWGCLLSYQIAIAQFMVGVFDFFKMDVYSVPNDPSSDLTSKGKMVSYLTNIILVFPNLPISLMKNLYNLRYMTIFSMVSLMYIQITFIILFFINIDTVSKNFDQTDWFNWSGGKNFKNLLSCYANTVFTYLCHQSIFPLMGELQKPSIQRLHKMAVSFEICFYCSFTIFAYFQLQENCQPLIINSIVNPEWTMLISKLAMMLNLFFAIPLTLNPARTNLFMLLKKPNPSNIYHFCITTGFLVTSCAVAIFYPQAKKVFGVLGGTAGTIIAFTLPGWMYIILSGKPYFKGLNLAIIIIDAVVTLGGFSGAVTSILN